jgi:hypothetical protein
MASRLLRAQWAFAQRVPYLLLQAHQLGFAVSLGDAYRDPRCPYGSKSSRHKSRLAIDLNLFNASGTYLTDTDDHRPLGEWWESIGGIWGGRFEDGNHYEGPMDPGLWVEGVLPTVDAPDDRLHEAFNHWFHE